MAERPIIEIKNLSKQYKGSDELALNDISLDIYPLEIFGFSGQTVRGRPLPSPSCADYLPQPGGKY